MTKVSELKKLLREVVGAKANIPIPGTVVSVSGDSCKVKIAGGLELTDVKLKATINESENFVLVTPKEGSKVLMVSQSGELDNMTVIKVDDIEKIEFVQGDLKVIVDGTDSKVGVENGTCSLKELFQDLADVIKQLKVFTAVGPSGTPLPDTIASVEAFELKFNALLK